MSAPRILVDADACPVKDEVRRVGARHGLKVVFVANFGLRPSRDAMIAHVTVAQGGTLPTTGSLTRRGPATSW